MADFQKPSTPSVAEALYTKDKPDEPACWFCTGCRTAKPSKEYAEACPQCAKWTCIACGEEASAFQKYCSKCLGRQLDEKEAKRLEAAERVPASQYPYDHGVVWDGNYYDGIDSLLDHCDAEGLESPKLVWATEPIRFWMDADAALENALDNWGDGFVEGIEIHDIEGVYEFRQAVKALNNANDHNFIYQQTDKTVELGK